MSNLELGGISITTDYDYPDKVEIGIVENGVLVEGGQFDLDSFIKHVLEFYNKNY